MSFDTIFDASYKRILSENKNGCGFFDAFYQRFLASDQHIAERFANTDMAIQQRMLKKSFYSLFAFYASGQADDAIRRIAEKHNQFNLNIKPEFYDLWLECLIATLKDYDDQFCDDIELAWRLVMTPGITYMKFKYDKRF
ncbi:hypothetical protein imdm_107 [gamma proteobacterium IMCC2047]|nr:hypothetical protein imdm_107 [gamma proteobacterium IMCC2047]